MRLGTVINSGTVGSQAVLELMSYPVYSGLISENMKQQALEGSKTNEQKEFERIQKKDLDNVQTMRGEFICEGMKLRRLKTRYEESIKKTRCAESTKNQKVKGLFRYS